jgi:hypothetical protein
LLIFVGRGSGTETFGLVFTGPPPDSCNSPRMVRMIASAWGQVSASGDGEDDRFAHPILTK